MWESRPLHSLIVTDKRSLITGKKYVSVVDLVRIYIRKCEARRCAAHDVAGFLLAKSFYFVQNAAIQVETGSRQTTVTYHALRAHFGPNCWLGLDGVSCSAGRRTPKQSPTSCQVLGMTEHMDRLVREISANLVHRQPLQPRRVVDCGYNQPSDICQGKLPVEGCSTGLVCPQPCY